MKLQTVVADEKCKVGISYKDKIMMLGSCFSDSLGRQLIELGFDLCSNPFGPLYNPISVLRSVERLISGEPFSEEDCIQIGAGDERYCSFNHYTAFACESQADFLAKANMALESAKKHFLAANKAIITLGTSWCYRHREKDFIVSNCLKRPAAEFIRERLSVKEVSSALSRIVELCNEPCELMNPKQFIFAVCPVRHLKDGPHGNQLSKATLLLGIDDFLAACPQDLSLEPRHTADYFPSYEIMMDELRDYRFYGEEMCHPTAQTVTYMRERLLNWALPSSEQLLLKENTRIMKRNRHFSPSTL